MTFIDFFAGIGGFRRGMELAGHRCVGFCENRDSESYGFETEDDDSCGKYEGYREGKGDGRL